MYRRRGMGVVNGNTPIYFGKRTSGRDEGIAPLVRAGVIPVDRDTVFDVSAPVYRMDTNPAPAPTPAPTPVVVVSNSPGPVTSDIAAGASSDSIIGLVPWWGWAGVALGAWWLFGGKR
jgi:hypothetical protein